LAGRRGGLMWLADRAVQLSFFLAIIATVEQEAADLAGSRLVVAVTRWRLRRRAN
jgi:hypothetical protein